MPGETVRVGAHTIEVSNMDKVLYPDDGLTKGDIVEYYRRISSTMLPHTRGRPVGMERFPDGLKGESFFQKNAPDYFPDWIPTVSVKKEKGHVTHVVCENQATLVYLAGQACITPHIWLSRKDKLDYPDRMIFDLDPVKSFESVRGAAGCLRDLLEELDLQTFVMTTGSRGLHLVVPLDRHSDFDTARSFARDVAGVCARRHPERLTLEQRVSKRQGRVFLDVMRNAYAQTSVAPYALRAKPGAPVATPLEWEEVTRGKLSPRQYTIKNIFKRLEQRGDLWEKISGPRSSLTQARSRLDKVLAKQELPQRKQASA
jgi:bifunctional non-homologous end joining protein LigD